MALDTGDKPIQKLKWYQLLYNGLKEYGWVALLILIASFFYYSYNDIYHLILERADKQAEINTRVGKLEGQVELLIGSIDKRRDK